MHAFGPFPSANISSLVKDASAALHPGNKSRVFEPPSDLRINLRRHGQTVVASYS